MKKLLLAIEKSSDFDVLCDKTAELETKVRRKKRSLTVATVISWIAFLVFFFLGIFYIFYSFTNWSAEDLKEIDDIAVLSFIVGLFPTVNPDWMSIIIAVVALLIGSPILGVIIGALCSLIPAKPSVTSKDYEGLSDKEKFKKLNDCFCLIKDTYNYNFVDYGMNKSLSIVTTILTFGGLIVGFILLDTLKNENIVELISFIIGMAICIVVFYWILRLLTLPCREIVNLFLSPRGKVMVEFDYAAKHLDTLWLENDPAENSRRQAEAQAEAQANAQSGKNTTKVNVRSTDFEPGTSTIPVLSDPFSWTEEFFEANEDDCVQKIISLQNSGLANLRKHNYKAAASDFILVTTGNFIFAQVDFGFYGPSLYASYYILARTLLFGMRDREDGCKYLKAACETAEFFATHDYPNSAMARRDYNVMNGMLNEFRSGKSIEEVSRIYGNRFPYDILESN